jgi:glycosyltransferase involved in cell wall biosynthesis
LNSLIQKSECSIDSPVNLRAGEYFVTVARLTHQKNIHLLLKSYARAREFGCRWPLAIIGDGEDKVNLLALSKELNLEKDVHFLGYQTNPHPHLVKAGAFVMSSREEGFPVSLLESMALGCPIISLACPTGPTDILKNGELGKLISFTEENPNELALAMFEISSNAAIRKKYAEESKLFAQNFSSQKIAQQLMSLLRDIASNQRA